MSNKIIRIIRVIPSLNLDLGGPQEAILKITPHLTKNNIETTVVTFNTPDSKHLKNLPFETIGLGPVNTKYGYKKGLRTKLNNLFKNYDVVIIHGLWQYHSFGSWRALKNLNKPYFVYTHGMLDPYFKTHKLTYLKKCLYWPWAEYKVIKDANAVLFTTEREKILARKSFFMYKANENVIGYGSSVPYKDYKTSKEKFLEKYPSLRNKKLILFLSRIDHKKGIDILIKAFKRISLKDESLQLIIAGPDPVDLKNRLQLLAKKQNITQKITWTGMLRDQLKWSAFNSADVFCLSSHTENFGIAIVEALACGIPVITTDKVNISDEISESGAGLICQDNTDDLYNTFEKWIHFSSEKKLDMKKKARLLFENKFELENNSKKLIKKIRDLV